eukprot:scaffold242021_cov41-Attheya_sp.AAC.1
MDSHRASITISRPFPCSFPNPRCRSGQSRVTEMGRVEERHDLSSILDTRRYAWIAWDPLRQTNGTDGEKQHTLPLAIIGQAIPTTDRWTILSVCTTPPQ